MTSLRITRARWDRLLTAAVLVMLVVYYGLSCFSIPWSWDLLRHAASVRAFQIDFLHPSHEAMAPWGTGSVMHTPYNLVLACLAEILEITPYRALQLAGVFNLIFYACGTILFFRAYSPAPQSWLPPAIFAVVQLFFRERIYGWSSETDFFTLRYIQAYPSFFGWGVALAVLALARRFLQEGGWWRAGLAGSAIAFTLPSHTITAGWLIGLMFALAAWSSIIERRSIARALVLVSAVFAGIAAALAWPYPPGLFGLSSYASYPERAPFEDHPLTDMPWVHALGLASMLWLALARRPIGSSAILLFLCSATWAGWLVLPALGIDFGSRFFLFQLFFMYAAIAGALGTMIAEKKRAALPLAAGAALLIFTTAREALLAGPERALPSIAELVRAPSAHDRHYERYGPLKPWLTREDVVLTAPSAEAYAVAEITDARVVLAVGAPDHPEYARREPAVARFFAATSSTAPPVELAHELGATKILLTRTEAHLKTALVARCGPPLVEERELVLIDTRECHSR